MLTISNLTYRVGGRLILENAAATVQDGWKVGVVGANGAGKSTLFKLITGELHADGGTINLSERRTLGEVKQDIPEDDTPLIDIVLAADKERAALFKQAETEEDPYAIADIYTRLEEIDAYAAPARASTILAGLGFKEEQMQMPISAFSGGWRMRVALAAALFQQPDFLLLDEPTNHLDLEAIMWLESYLSSYPKTVMIISHDRELLNVCVDHVLHVDNKKVTAYTGNYNTFERERAEKMAGQQKLHEKQMAQKAHMEAFINRFKAKASKARQAQSRLKALEKMDIVDAVMADRTVKFSFPQPDELPPPIVTINHADIGYARDTPILRNIHERIDMDDRIALLGANGNGKSTLIKLIAGKLDPLKGEMLASNKLRIGYFSQHQTEELDMNDTPVTAMARVLRGKAESDVRGVLGRFGFSKPLSDNTIKTLSGGEKARLLFAMISYNAPHLLLLDEPTNHLDMDTREALVQALNAYEGAVVIVSHDPSMIERVADRLWLVADGAVHPFDGDLEAYRQHIIAQRRSERRGAKTEKSGPSKKELKAQLAEKKKQHPSLWNAVEETEKRVAKLTSQKNQLEDDMTRENADIQGLQLSYGKLLRELEAAETDWMDAQTAFDNA